MSDAPSRLGVFGGSFDPVHHGHLIAAVSLMEALRLDQVRMVVAGQQPLKQGGHRASAEDRARMVQLAVEGHPGLRADGRELLRKGPSYTVDTLEELHEEWPQARLVLLIGSDAAAEMDRWHEPQRIRDLARVAVFRRGALATADRPGPAEFAVPRVEISSTEIRRRVAQGKSIRYWVPDAVADYLAQRRLYREGP
jgi:nicotinate-nucleotide adenylyltransferase